MYTSAARRGSTQRDSQTLDHESASMPWFVVYKVWGVDAMVRYPRREKRGGLELFGDQHQTSIEWAL